MAQAELDQLLERMPAIADAVEKFTSESIQSQVFDALINAFQSGTRSQADKVDADEADTGETARQEGGETPTAPPSNGGAKRSPRKAGSSRPKQSFSIDKELDMVRGGPKSLKDFVGEKQPRNVLDKVLVSVYWLTRVLEGEQPATLDRVYTCFKHMEWPIPSDLANTTQQAGVKGWLDSHKRDDLKVVIGGENRVEHDLPVEPKT